MALDRCGEHVAFATLEAPSSSLSGTVSLSSQRERQGERSESQYGIKKSDQREMIRPILTIHNVLITPYHIDGRVERFTKPQFVKRKHERINVAEKDVEQGSCLVLRRKPRCQCPDLILVQIPLADESLVMSRRGIALGG